MDIDLPYVAEYAKSSRASCKACKENIGKDTLRIGIMIQSPHFDGKIPLWHHCRCFLAKKKLKTTADVANFDNLRWEDQKKLKDHVATSANSTETSDDKGSSEFSIEYAKSSRSTCRECAEKILKGVIRISKLDTESPESRRYGPIPNWRHLDCFVKVRQDLGFIDAGEILPGFKSLSEEDKEEVKQKLGQVGIKRKTDSATASPNVEKKTVKKESKEDIALKNQNKLIYDMRDKLKANLSKKEMICLLEHNNQHISTGESNLLDNLTDCLLFGALSICPDCKTARPRFKIDAYRCSGHISEWTKCQYVSKFPQREKFVIPEELKEKYDFLNDYKYVKRERIFASNPDVPSSMAASNKKNLPLYDCKIAVIGRFKVPKSILTKKIQDLGGSIQTKINNSLMCCISTEDEVAKDSAKIVEARNQDVHVVSPNFLEDVRKGDKPALAMKQNLICSWGGDPVLKFGIKQEQSSNKKPEANSYSGSSSKSVSQTVKVSVTGAAGVDPESGLEDKCHVYQRKGNVYNAVLNKVDVAKGTNKYYKLQILEDNKKPKYWVFRSWGRVGTTIGGTKVEKMNDVSDAIELFESLYLRQTRNEWQNRKNFVKHVDSFYPLDIDYGQDCELQELKPGANSKLPKPVQELICLIFDIEAMKKAMLEFEIDLKKMPLGKLSKKQLQMAYSVLSEAQQILVTGCNKTKILDASNRFFTLIPHDFGLKHPPLLDDEELIKAKIEMLDSLMEIEFAYNMLKSDGKDTAKDPVDEHYEKLKAKISVLDQDSVEFTNIETYLKNTHAKTHDQYSLEISQVFKIDRSGESERYKKFKDLHNKKLLWHGSRLTNYVGILSQGLRIAPPEAPVTGYMFGKGVYFADMVSKSANYCFTSKKNPTALMLLCEVALGNMYEKKNAEYVTTLPKDKHSTKGLGQTIPDPSHKTFLGDVEIPYGKPVPSGVTNSALLYNEYIVYDVDQINIKYLLKVNFKWKH